MITVVKQIVVKIPYPVDGGQGGDGVAAVPVAPQGDVGRAAQPQDAIQVSPEGVEIPSAAHEVLIEIEADHTLIFYYRIYLPIRQVSCVIPHRFCVGVAGDKGPAGQLRQVPEPGLRQMGHVHQDM